MPDRLGAVRSVLASATALAVCAVGLIATPANACACGHTGFGLGPNAAVTEIVVDDNGTAFVGGDFTHWGVQTGGLGEFDAASAVANGEFPDVIEGVVEDVVSDGAGGYFIGGLFESVGGVDRENLAHIDSTGAVSDWQPWTSHSVDDGMVMSLELHDGVLYVGGRFDEVYDGDGDGPLPRRLLAAVDASTGEWLDWAPDPYQDASSGWWNLMNVAVFDLQVRNDVLYVGGNFDTIGGAAMADRPGAAAFDLAGLGTGQGLLPWNPDSDGPVLAIRDVGTGMALGGLFENLTASVTVVPRSSLAVVDYGSGVPTAFDVAVQAVSGSSTDPGEVHSLEVLGNSLIIGGSFTHIDDAAASLVPRGNLAQVYLAGELVLPWNPAPDGTVEALTYDDDSTMWVGGGFDVIGAEPLSGLAKFDTGVLQNAPEAFDAGLDTADVRGILSEGDQVVIGGIFTTANSTPVNHIAKVNRDGSVDTDFELELPAGVTEINTVTGMHLWNGALYVALWNTSGSPTHQVIEVDVDTGSVTSLVEMDDRARAIDASADRLFVVGDFTNVTPDGMSSVSRDYAYALELNTTLSSWAPVLAGYADDLLVVGDDVYVTGAGPGGLGTLPYAVRATAEGAGSLDSWSVDFTTGGLAQYGTAHSLAYWNGDIAIGGRMLNSTGVVDNGTSLEVASSTNASDVWNPLLSGRSRVRGMLSDAGDLYFVGTGFFDVGGSVEVGPSMGLIDDSRELVDWGPQLDGGAEAIADGGDVLLVGGAFTHSEGVRAGSPRAYLAWVNKYAPVDPDNGGGSGGGSGGEGSSFAPTSNVTASATPSGPAAQPIGPDINVRLAPGEVAILVDGRRLPARARPHATNTALTVSGGGMTMMVPSHGGLGGRGAPRWKPGAEVGVTATGLAVGSTAASYLLSEPLLVGQSQVPAAGPVRVKAQVPASFAVGNHTLQLVGTNLGGQPVIVAVGLQVVAEQSVRGSSVYFGYDSSRLTPRARATLRSLVRQSEGMRSNSQAHVRALVRRVGDSAADRQLARERARIVADFLTRAGFEGRVVSTVGRAQVSGTWVDRRVDVTVRSG